MKKFLINNKVYCKVIFQEEINIFTFTDDNTNFLVGDNTFINNAFNIGLLVFSYSTKVKKKEENDNSANISIEAFSKK